MLLISFDVRYAGHLTYELVKTNFLNYLLKNLDKFM